MNYDEIIKAAEKVSIRERETATSLIDVPRIKSKAKKNNKHKKYTLEELADTYIRIREKERKYDWTAQFLNYLHENE